MPYYIYQLNTKRDILFFGSTCKDGVEVVQRSIHNKESIFNSYVDASGYSLFTRHITINRYYGRLVIQRLQKNKKQRTIK
tara:strand:- start:3193 stop:3432 length:240 start_codon:yes stop_codon:yes gene_type:complete